MDTKIPTTGGELAHAIAKKGFRRGTSYWDDETWRGTTATNPESIAPIVVEAARANPPLVLKPGDENIPIEDTTLGSLLKYILHGEDGDQLKDPWPTAAHLETLPAVIALTKDLDELWENPGGPECQASGLAGSIHMLTYSYRGLPGKAATELIAKAVDALAACRPKTTGKTRGTVEEFKAELAHRAKDNHYDFEGWDVRALENLARATQTRNWEALGECWDEKSNSRQQMLCAIINGTCEGRLGKALRSLNVTAKTIAQQQRSSPEL